MIIKSIPHFDLKKICESGQIFRMYERRPGVFDIFSGDRFLRAVQKTHSRQKTYFFCTEEEFGQYWHRYFDLDRDYDSLIGMAMNSEDDFLKNACCFGGDIRVLHQNIWEMMISFIISQQKQIPSIRKCIEGLCERFGEKRTTRVECSILTDSEEIDDNGYETEEITGYTFPTPESIVSAGPDGLKGLSLGYRERYIYETAVRYLENGLPDDTVEAMDYQAAKDYFLSFTGIGEKVANCILLFGAGFADAFPIDTHIKDILYREYYIAGKEPQKHSEGLNLTIVQYKKIIDEHFEAYSGNRGIVQQWIFAYELNR